MGEVFVGIVESGSSESLAVGLVDEEGGRIGGSSFAIEKAPLNDYYVPQPDGRRAYRMPADLADLGRFLHDAIPEGSRVTFLFEVPEAIPHPAGDPGAIPHPVLTADSVLLKVLVFLGVQGVVAAPLKTDPDVSTAVLFPTLGDGDMAHPAPAVPRYLPRGICKAYGELLSLDCERHEHVAIVGALIAKNPGAYHFWSSIGRVQSSQDVLEDLRHDEPNETSVWSAREGYITDFTAATVYEAIDDLPLEYALTEKRYAHLGPGDSIKAALIHVCRQWRISLRCSSSRDDADDRDRQFPVYPLGVFESVVIGALRHAEQQKIWPDPALTVPIWLYIDSRLRPTTSRYS
jgi:hypothetical protein